MVIQHNMTAMNANRNLGTTSKKLSKSTEKLSSGYKINRAGDNAAGLAISEKMRGQIRGLDQASTNAEDGISLIQTAEGALTETHSIIQRMRELAVQSASDTNTDDDRTQIQNEIDELTEEVDRIANTTEFNTMKLLNGNRKGAVSSKEGTGKLEGTFAKANVKAMTSTAKFSFAGVTDVIRIEITADITDADAGFKLDNVNLTSIFGNVKQNGAGVTLTGVTAGSGSAKITLNKSLFYDKLSADGKTNATASKDITLEISGANNLKAGDVITITIGEAIKTESAPTGRDALRLQVGANSGQEIKLGINDMGTKGLKISKDGNALDVASQSGAAKAIEAYDMAIQKVSTERAKLGATQNRLEHTIANLDTSSENLQAAESSLRDTDMADEMTRYSKNNILMQAGQSMLAQANQSTQGVTQLLQ